MDYVGVHKVGGTHEECLQTLLGSGYHSGVVAEEQSSHYGDQHYGKQVGFTAFFWIIH